MIQRYKITYPEMIEKCEGENIEGWCEASEVHELESELAAAKAELAQIKGISENVAFESGRLSAINQQLKAELARLKAQPARVVDAEKLIIELERISRSFDPYEMKAEYEPIGFHRAKSIIESLATPAPDYMGALRTLAGELCDALAQTKDGCKNCQADCTMVNQYDDEDRTDECLQTLIDHAFEHPTPEA